jgi:predicted  nucleic acid-binding Zn-ribbon protein
METKEELVTNIKEWIKIDTEITQLQSEIKGRKNKKKELTEALMGVMKKNEIDCFDINGGSLVYKKNKVKKPINAKTLITTLKSYFETSPAKAEEITKFILDNREEEVKESIKRKVDK